MSPTHSVHRWAQHAGERVRDREISHRPRVTRQLDRPLEVLDTFLGRALFERGRGAHMSERGRSEVFRALDQADTG